MQTNMNRRHLLTGAIVGAAGLSALPASAVTLSAEDTTGRDPRLAELVALTDDLRAAIRKVDDGGLSEEEINAVLHRPEAELGCKMEELFQSMSSPPTPSELAMCACLADYFVNRCPGSDDPQADYATQQLIKAVLASAGLQPSENTTRTAETVADFIRLMGGPHVIADFCGISTQEVERWASREFIPPGWHYRLASFASRRHVRISHTIFGGLS